MIRDGWYVTGDIATIDEAGFIQITDRLSRFSKIAGEMVPHMRVEEQIQALVSDHFTAVVTGVPDDAKGERLVAFYTDPDVTPQQLWERLCQSELPRLWLPKRQDLEFIESVPTLGTGKVDLRAYVSWRSLASKQRFSTVEISMMIDELETRIGSRWLLYIGVVAIIVGVAYFEKLAIDNHWITETARVIQGGVIGLLLIAGGLQFVRRGYRLYGQILSGGGIAILYVSTYAAFNFYHLLSQPVAFGVMCAVTMLAAWLANRERSQGLALVAVGGGFATPFLLPASTDAQVALFGYDTILIAGTMFLSRRRDWPMLNVVSYGFTVLTFFAWAGSVLHPVEVPHDRAVPDDLLRDVSVHPSRDLALGSPVGEGRTRHSVDRADRLLLPVAGDSCRSLDRVADLPRAPVARRRARQHTHRFMGPSRVLVCRGGATADLE